MLLDIFGQCVWRGGKAILVSQVCLHAVERRLVEGRSIDKQLGQLAFERPVDAGVLSGLAADTDQHITCGAPLAWRKPDRRPIVAQFCLASVANHGGDAGAIADRRFAPGSVNHAAQAAGCRVEVVLAPLLRSTPLGQQGSELAFRYRVGGNDRERLPGREIERGRLAEVQELTVAEPDGRPVAEGGFRPIGGEGSDRSVGRGCLQRSGRAIV